MSLLMFVIVAALAVIIFGIGLTVGRKQAETPAQKYERELRELRERDEAAERVHAAAGNLGEVRDLVASGNKIGAIKAFRELTGCGLKEAKDAVEAIERGEA